MASTGLPDSRNRESPPPGPHLAACRRRRPSYASRATPRVLPRSVLRVDAAKAVYGGNTADRQHVRRRAHVHSVLARKLEHVGKAPRHDLGETIVHRLFVPEIAAAVLHPLEIRDRDAPGVGEDIGNDEDAL